MEILFVKIVYSLFWLATTLIRLPFSKAIKTNEITISRKTTLEKVLLSLTVIGFFLLPFLYITSPMLSIADYRSNFWIQSTGIAIMPLSLWLFYRSHKDLGKNWSISLEITKEHTLVDWGVYKHVRHPMYTAIWLWVLAQAFVLPNWIAGFSGLFAFGIMYFLRIDKEEKMMMEQFGEQYANYKRKTKRLIPFIL